MIHLTHRTRIAVQVIIEDEIDNLAALVAALTMLFTLLAYLGRLAKEVNLFVNDLTEAARFVTTVFTIGCRSLAWGFVGVRV